MTKPRYLTDDQWQELLGLIAEAGAAAVAEALAAYVARYAHNFSAAAKLRSAAEELKR